MSQAEVAGGKLSSPGHPPERGYRLRDFSLRAADGKELSVSDYRGRRNLVLLLAGGAESAGALLEQAGQQHPRLQEEDARLLAVMQADAESVGKLAQGLPFPVLVDKDGRIHRQLGAAQADGKPASAVYITDGYGEVFGAYRTARGQAMPTANEILDWLSFINRQCPECEPPEWPL